MVTRKSAIETAESFIDECVRSGLTFRKVLMFGSVVKGTMHDWSDIDLLLISDDFTDNIFRNLSLYSKINIRFPVIETHPYPTRHYHDGDAFIESIEKEDLQIYPKSNIRPA
jgi:predicted nucleotidyltransferase